MKRSRSPEDDFSRKRARAVLHVGHVGDSWRQLCTERGLGQRETLDFVIKRARWTNQLLEP